MIPAKEIKMAKAKEVTYLIKVQSKYDRNKWITHCETPCLELAESIMDKMEVSVHLAKKTVETTYEMIAEKK